MRAAVTPDHREFFFRNHYIEFEAMLPEVDCEHVKEQIDAVLFKRTKKPVETQTSRELFAAGRDVFRDDALIRKFLLNRVLSHTFSLLFDAPVVRIAYDEALRTTTPAFNPFSQPLGLQKRSGFQSLLGGAIIRLTPATPTLEEKPRAFIPQKVGSVVFFRPDAPFPWPTFFQEPNQSFLLIAYAPERCRYIITPEDPHGHALKKLGYGAGDLLTNELHPIAFRHTL